MRASWTASSAAYPSRRIRRAIAYSRWYAAAARASNASWSPRCARSTSSVVTPTPRSDADICRVHRVWRRQSSESFESSTGRRGSRVPRHGLGSRGELRIAASSMASCGDDVQRARRRSRALRSVGRWPTLAQQPSDRADGGAGARWRRPRSATRRRARRRPAPARDRAIAAVEVEHLRAGPRPAPSRGRACRASRARARARGRARRRCRSPGRRPRGATPAASASAPRGPCRRRRRAAATSPTVRIDAERHRLGERVRVGRQERFERVGHRVDAGRGGRGRRQADGQRRDRGSSRPAAATDGRCSPCARPPRR